MLGFVRILRNDAVHPFILREGDGNLREVKGCALVGSR